MTADPTQQVFWLASRAFGIVAIIMLAISVGLGLAMSGRIIRRPGLPAKLKRYHEASTLVTLGLIVAHAGILLADGYLRPGIAGITLPFQMSYRPLWTGIGIIAAWLLAILGPSFYARKWIGVKTWRWLHRWIIAAYLLALAHVVGAGTDPAFALDARPADHPHRSHRLRVHLPHAPQAVAVRPFHTTGGSAHRRPEIRGRRRLSAGQLCSVERWRRRTTTHPAPLRPPA